MSFRWPPGAPPLDELGVVAHGPVVIARAPDRTVALRCVFAHPRGLYLPVVVRARGTSADQLAAADADATATDRDCCRPQLAIEMNGRRGVAQPCSRTSAAARGRFGAEESYWVDELPADGRLGLATAWPPALLPAETCWLTLRLDADLAGLVIDLA